MIKIGITGLIGSGKTMISRILNTMEIPVYNADLNAKILMLENPVIKNRLIAEFGENIYLDNQLNKELLSQLVFNNEQKRLLVNSIVHPIVIEDFVNWTSEQHGKIVSIESALLFESNLYELLDYSIIVISDTELMLERIMIRDDLSYSDALARINLQKKNFNIPNINKIEIYNNHTDSLVLQTLEILKDNKWLN